MHNQETSGLRHARWIYRREVLMLLRPSVVRRFNSTSFSLFPHSLLRHYLLIAGRNILKHKLFSFINIMGLAMSLSVALVILVMLADLLRFDEFHTDKDRIYRVISHVHTSHNGVQPLATTVLPLADRLESTYGGSENVVRIQRNFSADATYQDREIVLNGYWVGEDFFDVFSFELISGNPRTALQEPYTLVISQSAAEKLFGKKDPLGEMVQMDENGSYRVSGVVKDTPRFSHLQFDVLGSFATIGSLEKKGVIRPTLDTWNEFYSNYLYLKLAPSSEPVRIQNALDQIAAKAYQQEEGFHATFELQPLTQIVPGRDLGMQIGPKMMYLPLFILSGLALVILLSACFNYTNLSIARYIGRAKEVGVRKVSGARGSQIFFQFVSESMLIALLALGLALLIFVRIRPEIFQVIPRAHEIFELALGTKIFIVFVLFTLMTGFIAGFFPALFLSRLNPVDVMRRILSLRLFGKLGVRKVLIVFQFTLSLIFILAVSIIYSQYQFSLNHDLGFAQENILNLDMQGQEGAIIAQEFGKIPEVREISFSSFIPGLGTTYRSWVKLPTQADSLLGYFMDIDSRFIANFDIQWIAGGNFTDNSHRGMEREAIINEQFVESLQLSSPEAALGQTIEVDENTLQVVGVIKDFHYTHLEEPIKPFFFRNRPQHHSYANLKIQSGQIAETLAKLEETWGTIDPTHSFEASFMDEQVELAYLFYTNILKLFGFLAVLAISIAGLGLLGMVVFTSETKIQEIGIRKVMGASVMNLVVLLSRGFVRLLLISALIAIPLAYLVFDRLVLAQIAYRINIGITELGSGLLFLLVLGVLIIGSQTFRAAHRNPVESLRHE